VGSGASRVYRPARRHHNKACKAVGVEIESGWVYAAVTMKIFATYNIKGGVGKTAAAVNLGYLSGRSGFRTLIWDLDAQGAASFYFRTRAHIKGGSEGLLKRKRRVRQCRPDPGGFFLAQSGYRPCRKKEFRRYAD
jgi:cellulose biosynthesis protein BcsQ